MIIFLRVLGRNDGSNIVFNHIKSVFVIKRYQQDQFDSLSCGRTELISNFFNTYLNSNCFMGGEKNNFYN